MRWLIQDQIAGKSELNFDTSKGEVKSPLLLWGPYLWADGETPRKADGLIYQREDLRDSDGTHPSDSGRQKVADQLLKFFKSDATAKMWHDSVRRYQSRLDRVAERRFEDLDVTVTVWRDVSAPPHVGLRGGK